VTDVVHEISINAPPERVFDAISTTDGIRGWWADDAVYDGKLAGKAQVKFGRPPAALTMETTVFCKDEEILWRCLNGPPDWIGTNVSWLLESDADGGTRVRLQHSNPRAGAAGPPDQDAIWRELLAGLKQYVEGGAPGPLFGSR
jgi:uncharacterized protein YndB with AHSA1/START domain